ncbi:GNAT family N-acetyltransferase [Niveibacterium sp. 24ML]|uniref:GNAT family N-acetyltransferase n=1 Tax=Niveibacterium sp. 24ML TaxID=2985512 RepID=UPI00226E7048|nr:GNAT family N-acetyltransferase [Niveibacterium sp. 24ML]MCX9156862.1 GNAT family N-acetyltransferase [Niveibacterium sp. 24ML]
MTITWEIRPGSALEAAAQEWDTLCADIGAMPFLETRFLLPLLKHFGSGKEQLCLARDKGVLIAAALLAPTAWARWETFQPSQLPLGPWIQQQSVSLETLLGGLIQRLPGFALTLGATQLDPIFTPQPEDSRQLNSIPYIDTAWVDIAEPFDAYWSRRGKNLRTNVRKQRTKLEEDGTVLTLDILTDRGSVEAAIREYGRLEATGWKAEAGTAVTLGTPQGDFYRDMLEAFCEQGRGEIWRYRFGDAVVAMDLSIRSPDTLVVLKTAFDAAQKAVSPATLLHHDAFRSVFERGTIRRIEFYGRVMEWHTRWTESQRTLYHTTRWRWSALVHAKQLLAGISRSRQTTTSTSVPNHEVPLSTNADAR